MRAKPSPLRERTHAQADEKMFDPSPRSGPDQVASVAPWDVAHACDGAAP
jgi:hypothetical protein